MKCEHAQTADRSLFISECRAHGRRFTCGQKSPANLLCFGLVNTPANCLLSKRSYSTLTIQVGSVTTLRTAFNRLFDRGSPGSPTTGPAIDRNIPFRQEIVVAVLFDCGYYSQGSTLRKILKKRIDLTKVFSLSMNENGTRCDCGSSQRLPCIYFSRLF